MFEPDFRDRQGLKTARGTRRSAGRFPGAAVLTAALLFLSLAVVPAASPAGKVDPLLLRELAKGGAVPCLVMLSDQADLSLARFIPDKAERGRWVYEQLTFTARNAQGALLSRLGKAGVPHRAFWIVNMVGVSADAGLVEELAGRDDVRCVYADPQVRLALPCPTALSPGMAAAVEWNLTKVRAPEAWNLGVRGAGVVVAGADTGYDWDHPALKSKYRGWDGANANHNYNWHDAVHAGGSTCGADSPEPCDDYGHGTHTMGTMVGEDGANQIGMAPQARWIGCRNMNGGVGSPTTYIECMQWFLAPTDLAGNNPDPSRAPDVINNSWGCPPDEGCTDPNVLQSAVASLRAAGIMVVASAGNSGSACSSITDPIAIYDESFTVGNTTSTDAISGSSSRGPVTVDGSNRLKPDVSAPGTNIRSCYPGTGYTTMSGTSMAGPHVAGLVALLISAAPALRGDVDALEAAIRTTAVPLTTTQTCGGVPGSSIPNNTFGYGRIDAFAAVSAVLPPGPLITTHPQSAGVCSGTTTSLSVTANGTGTLHYAWYQGAPGDTSIPVGTDSPSLTTSPVTTVVSYWVRVTDDEGSVDSLAATLTPLALPQIVSGPDDRRIPQKTAVTLTVTVAGGSPSFQWYQGTAGDTSTPVGTNAASYTTPSLTVNTNYWVRASNLCGAVDSRTALVRVYNPGADLNEDGYINAVDLSLEAGFLAANLTELPCGTWCADVNGDHEVNALDLWAVFKEITE
ncbi:MAG: S8 family serine peptidase [Acidobacteria bacterium]|nr:S8 family serine peptidase [Acidobacteriota bacterium]